MRLYVRELIEIGALERHRRKSFPSSTSYSVTPSGRALLEVSGLLQRWLWESPNGPIPPGSAAFKNVIRALAEGWSTNLVRALSAKPFSLTELSKLIPGVGYPSIERRLGAMCRTGLLRKVKDGRTSLYTMTPWLRSAVVPLVAAACWERRFAPDQTAPVQRVDVEAAFLLAVPLVKLNPALSGSCRLVVDVGSTPAGVQLGIEEGEVVSCSTKLKGEVDGYASGSPAAWFWRMSGEEGELSFDRESSVAQAMVDALAELAGDR
jgi:DNA-binding HxlR family transcriptional regulator